MTDPTPHARRHRSRTLAAVTTGAMLTAALSACTSSKSGDSSAAPSHSAASPATAANARIVNVTVTAAKGCSAERSTYPAGALTFTVKNSDATAVSEVEVLDGQRIVGEKENLPAGFSGEFAVNVTAGTYTLYCPGATPERRAIKVTGEATGSTDATVAALLTQATKGYAKYVNTQVAALVTAVERFNTALHGTDLAAAQAAYMKARPFYEKIEPVAESFVIGKDVVDADIDIRAGDIPFSKWRGFHRIEYALFKQHTLKGMGAFGVKLVADIKKLQGLTANLTYKPTELANGAQGLLDEVAASKITGEEEAYSHIDLLDFANNDEGAEQAFAQLQPALDKIDAALSKDIRSKFAALDSLVERYRTESNPSEYVLYTSLTKRDKTRLAAAVKAVQEPLSKVASKVANA